MTTHSGWGRGFAFWATLISAGCGSATLTHPDGGSAGAPSGGGGAPSGGGGAIVVTGAAGHAGAGGGATGGSAGVGSGGAAAGGSGGTAAGGSGGAAAGGTGGTAAGGAGGTAVGGAAGGGAGGANPCADGVRDGAETDVDCGGGTCGKCNVNKACSVDGDCKTGSCSHLFCALVSGPPNWLTGPSLTYGRGYVYGGVALGSGGQYTLYVNGGRDDANTDDPALSNYEAYNSGPGAAWLAYLTDVGTVGPTATDAAGEMLVFSSSSTWRMSFPRAWKNLNTIVPTPRDLAAAAPGKNGLVYVVGGQWTDISGAIEGYDPLANKWTTGLKDMPTPRYNLAAALGVDGLIYAMGGESSLGSVATVEAYDPAANSWSTKSSLPAPDFVLTAVSGPDGRIYALGGLAGTINAFTPATNRWTPVVALSDSRAGVGAAVAPDGHLWAIGGTTNPEIPGDATVQIYGPSVSVTPSMGAPGTSIVVIGSNFAANATVSIYFGSASGTPLATGTTDPIGKLPPAGITLKVPSLAGGPQPLIAVDDRSQYPITLTFQVQ